MNIINPAAIDILKMFEVFPALLTSLNKIITLYIVIRATGVANIIYQ